MTGIKAQDIPSVPADSAYGVVSVSVCNMRAEGKFTSGMTTQALLGMPVKVLQYTGWYEIQTPDDYTGWCIGWLSARCLKRSTMNGTGQRR